MEDFMLGIDPRLNDILRDVRLNEISDEESRYENRVNHLIAEGSEKVRQELEPKGEWLIPAVVGREFLHLLKLQTYLRGKERSNEHIPPLDEAVCRDTAEKTFWALAQVFQKDVPITPKNEKALVSAMTLNLSVYDRLIFDEDRKCRNLLKRLPGKTVEEKMHRFCETHPIGGAELTELMGYLSERTEHLKDMMRIFISKQDECMSNLLFKSSFWDRCIDKNSFPLISYLCTYFKNHQKVMVQYIEGHNEYLNSKEEGAYGYSYILNNSSFASVLRNQVEPSDWTTNMAMAFAYSSVYKNASSEGLADIIKKLETLPPSRLDNLSKDIIQGLSFVFSEFEPDDLVRYEVRRLLPLMTRTKQPALKKRAFSFFNRMGTAFIQTVIDQDLSPFEKQAICAFLMSSHQGWRHLSKLTLKDGKNLVWDVYAQKGISDENMERLIRTAVEQEDTDFLCAQKDIVLTPKLPAYEVVHRYFENSVRAIPFVNSFKRTAIAAEEQFDQLDGFISDTRKRLKLARLYRVIPYWAKSERMFGIFSFFYDGDYSKMSQVTPKFKTKQIAEYFAQQDTTGRTAWHYFCMYKNRMFFSRLFKDLHPFFIAACQIKDNDGKTPLDYVKDDLKFRQLLAEKISAVKDLILASGSTLEHVPEPRMKFEPSQPVKSAEPESTPAVEKEPFVWKIEWLGNDKNRKNKEYLAEIQMEVDTLPEPQCGPVNVANNRLQKKEVLGVTVLKITYGNHPWRIPFVKDDATGTVYILPGSDRNGTYSNQDYCRMIRNRAKKIKRMQRQQARERKNQQRQREA